MAGDLSAGSRPADARGTLLREPLVHFLAAGALLFGLYALAGGADGGGADEISVTAGRVESLAAGFARTWARPPTRAELDELIDEYVVEEIYYREARALGLDQDDTVIRRRLRQKMEFLADAAPPEPTDAELAAHLARHADRFTGPARTSFVQVFIAADRPGSEAEAARLLAQLRSDRTAASPLDLGDPTLLPSGMEAATPQDIDSVFGRELTVAVEGAPDGQWSGPFRSGYGWHLVRVTARAAAQVPDLAAIRPQVLADWQEGQRRAAVAATLGELRRKYRVIIADPLVVAGTPP